MTSRTGKRTPPAATIPVRNRQRRVGIDLRAVERFAAAALESLGMSGGTFEIAFVGAAAMRRLNRDWRGKDRATDVLSFAYGGEVVCGAPLLGEVVIAPEVAVRFAEAYGVAPEKEIRKLLVHGLLHLMGYDHEADNGEMQHKQRQVLRRRFFAEPPPLLAPVPAPARGKSR